MNVRVLAGLHLNNLVSAKAEHLREEKVKRWMAIDATSRQTIKSLLLGAVSSAETTAVHTGAQAAAEIAAVELPYGQWPEFLPALMENVSAVTNRPNGVKVSSLECLGYTAELLAAQSKEIAQDATNQMLTTIVDGVRADRPDDVRHAAAVALRNSVFFTAKNMENENERNIIMQAVCEATQSTAIGVRCVAYECIDRMCFYYYDKLATHMQTLFDLTFQAIKSDEETVALRAIEFWSTLCDVEMVLLDEMDAASARGKDPEQHCARYVNAALEHLIPLLTEQLMKQDEDTFDDLGTRNISKAAGKCLELVGITVGDRIVPFVMPFVQANIKSENWRLCEASMRMFGSVLNGLSAEVMAPYVIQSIPVLLGALADPHTMVKYRSAWTLGQVCYFFRVQAIPNDCFTSLVTGLNGILMTEAPRVASEATWALRALATALSADDSNSESNALSPFMKTLLQTLLQTTERKGWDACKLRMDAYEAVKVLIQHSARDCKPLVRHMLPAIVGRLSASIPMPTNEESEHKEGLQGQLCGVVHVLCQNLDKESLLPYADTIMQGTLQVLQTNNATAHEKALLATGALVDQLEADFEKYLPHLQPFVVSCLRNFEAYQVCAVTVGLVGDLCRAVEDKMQPYCDKIVETLLQSLQNPTLHSSVKLLVLSCFGDIALAMGAPFQKYLQVVELVMMQASQREATENEEELAGSVGTPHEIIFEAKMKIYVAMALREGDIAPAA